RWSGRVNDAVTGKPINDFLVVPIIYFNPDFPYLARSLAERQTDGRLSMEFDRTDIEHGVQIEAAGYRPFRTPERYRIGQKNPDLDIRLQPTQPYRGKVLDPD